MLTISLTVPSSSAESVQTDYELLCSMFQDEIIEICDSASELAYIIKQSYEIEITQGTAQLLRGLSVDELLLNDTLMYFPYWIRFNYDRDTRVLAVNFHIYWIKYNKSIIEALNEVVSHTEEPYLYSIVDNVKVTLQHSIDKDLLINIIQEISEFTLIDIDQSPNNFLFQATGANKDLEDFRYSSKKALKDAKLEHLPAKEEKELLFQLQSSIETDKLQKKEAKDIENAYEKFFQCGGVIGEPIQDRKSIFQAHAIKVKSKADVERYREYLLSHRKIKKATHNISAYRLFNEETNETIEDYDDDGESEAGIKLLGVVKVMKITNVFVMVTRWFGGILLYQDRFKHINDAARLLFNKNSEIFDVDK